MHANSGTIHAVVFNRKEQPIRFLTGSAATLNMNMAAGQVWRVIDPDIVEFDNVPPMKSLPVHPAFKAKS